MGGNDGEDTLSADEPITALQAVRQAMGWKQSRVLAALAEQAKRDGVSIAGPASLKTMLSRWENGFGQPDPTYQRLFCAVYEREAAELGFGRTTTRSARTLAAPIINADTVAYFSAVLEQHIRADYLLGPQHLVDVVRAQTELLDRILPDTRPGAVRNELFRLACRYYELTGWLCQDAGDPNTAMGYTDRAMDLAVAVDDPSITLYLLMRKSNITSDRGVPDRAVSLADSAARLMHKAEPRARALVLVQQARAHALRGGRDNSLRALDRARREISRSDPGGDPLTNYCTPEYVAMESAASWASLGQSAKAIPALERALSSWPATQRRDLGLCQARLTAAYADRGDTQLAVETGMQAVDTVRTATSVRAVRELARARETLMPWRRQSDVAELITLIKGLNHYA
jgi:propanediol dehydratase small subunit